MEHPVFRQVPEWNAVFKVTEGHGFEKVVYAGEGTGVTGCLHRHCSELEAELLCYCHPRLVILPITEQQYRAVFQQVTGSKAA